MADYASLIRPTCYHSADIPLFALAAYAKNERADLSQKDRNDFRQLTKLLAETYGRTQR
jgi:hypothetical protein